MHQMRIQQEDGTWKKFSEPFDRDTWKETERAYRDGRTVEVNRELYQFITAYELGKEAGLGR
jgi:hypothetical protein